MLSATPGETGQTCIALQDTRRPRGTPALTQRCTYGIAWMASAKRRANAELEFQGGIAMRARRLGCQVLTIACALATVACDPAVGARTADGASGGKSAAGGFAITPGTSRA